MKLLLDQGLARSTARALCAAGIDTEHVGDIGLSEASDHDIIVYARRGSRVVVTLDADFHAILALSGAPAPSVIRDIVQRLDQHPPGQREQDHGVVVAGTA